MNIGQGTLRVLLLVVAGVGGSFSQTGAHAAPADVDAPPAQEVNGTGHQGDEASTPSAKKTPKPDSSQANEPANIDADNTEPSEERNSSAPLPAPPDDAASKLGIDTGSPPPQQPASGPEMSSPEGVSTASGLKPKPSQTVNAIREFLDAYDPMFLISLLLGLISLVSVGISFWLYRWRRLIVQGEAVLVPEKWGAAINRQTESHGQMYNAFVSTVENLDARNQEVWTKLSDLNETIDAMRKAIAERDQAIRRLQEGQDSFVFRKFLHRFIAVAGEFDAQLGDEEQVADIELLRDLLGQAIEECGVEQFEPDIGVDYLTAQGVADRPVIDECSDPSQQNQISRIIEPGYCVPNGNETTVVVPAKVAVWRIPNEQPEPNEPEEKE